MYKIPSDKEIKEALIKVLKKYREIGSQKLLKKLVLEELRGIDRYYVVSDERIRKIAFQINEIKIDMLKRKSRREAIKCYICGGELETVKVKNLFGEEVPLGKKCKTCGLVLERASLAPKKYIFVYRK